MNSGKNIPTRTERLSIFSHFRRRRETKLSEPSGFELRLKRILDIVISAISIFLLLPAIAIIALIIRICAVKSVLAKQIMLGLYQKSFRRLLFHTNETTTGAAAADIGFRLPAFNHFLQQSGFDKLPQFFNVLIGNMSIVGPRPHPPELRLGFHRCEIVIAEYRSRFHVRPGITGLAQVSGTAGCDYNVATVVAEVEMDLRYIRERSLWLDMKIMARKLVDELFSLEKML